jgi:hypothetical protein
MKTRPPTSWLVILGHREAIYWVMSNQRMAFPPHRLTSAERLAPGDALLFYATRGAWRNPTRDRGRIFAAGTVRTRVRKLSSSLELAGRSFTSWCDLSIVAVAPYPTGVELAPIINKLDAFPNREAWAARLRRPLLHLGERDFDLLSAAFEEEVAPVARRRALADYLKAARL